MTDRVLKILSIIKEDRVLRSKHQRHHIQVVVVVDLVFVAVHSVLLAGEALESMLLHDPEVLGFAGVLRAHLELLNDVGEVVDQILLEVDLPRDLALIEGEVNEVHRQSDVKLEAAADLPLYLILDRVLVLRYRPSLPDLFLSNAVFQFVLAELLVVHLVKANHELEVQQLAGDRGEVDLPGKRQVGEVRVLEDDVLLQSLREKYRPGREDEEHRDDQGEQR